MPGTEPALKFAEYRSHGALPVRTASVSGNVTKNSSGHFWSGRPHPPQGAASLVEIRPPLTTLPSSVAPSPGVHLSQ